MRTVRNNIIKILEDRGVNYEKISHEPVFTMKEAEKTCGNKKEEGIKTLFLKSEGVLFLSVIRGDHKLNFKNAKELLSTKKIYMADEDDLESIRVTRGGLSPFGYEKPLLVLLDRSINKADFCYINPGVNTETFKLKSRDLVEAIHSWAKKVILM